MSTVKQKRVAQLIVENVKRKKPLTKLQMLDNAGYSGKGVVQHPRKVIESIGVKAELEILGFNEYSAKKVVQEIMLDDSVDPNARLKATDQVFKVHKSYGESDDNGKINIIIIPPREYGSGDTDKRIHG